MPMPIWSLKASLDANEVRHAIRHFSSCAIPANLLEKETSLKTNCFHDAHRNEYARTGHIVAHVACIRNVSLRT